MRHPPATWRSLNGVRKPCCIRTRACPIRILHGEYSCDVIAGGRGGKSLGGGWHCLHYFLNLPGSAVPANLGALKGSQGRRCAT